MVVGIPLFVWNSNEKSNKPPIPNAYNSLVDEYLTNTSITVVNNVQRSKSKFSKIMWLVVGICSCVAMLRQSFTVFTEYSRCSMKEDKKYEAEKFPPFPSVTACDGMPVNWTLLESVNHSFVMEMNKIKLNDSVERARALIMGLLHMRQTEREALYNTTAVFDPKAWFPPKTELIQDSVRFRHPYFGQCITINPGMGVGQSAVDMVNLCSVHAMNIKFPITLHGRVPGIHGRVTGYLLIHPRGTPPIFNRANVITIFPFNKISIEVMQTNVKVRLQRACLTCTDRNDAIRKQSIYYDANVSPYIYTREGCIKTASQKILLQQRNCIDAYSHLLKLPRGVNKETKLCTGNEIFDVSGLCDSGCNEFLTSVNIGRWSKLFDTTLLQNLSKFKEISSSDANGFYSLNDDGAYEYDNSMDAVIKIHQPKGYLQVTQMPTYSFDDMIGIIGGNTGLWLGISVCSLCEIIELVYMLGVKWIQRRKQSKATSNDLRTANWPTNYDKDLYQDQITKQTRVETILHIYD